MKRWVVLFERIKAVREKCSDCSPAQLQSLIDEPTAVVREEMIREGRFLLQLPSNP